MIGILFGFLGAIFIGISDSIGRVTSRQISINILILYIMGISTIIMTICFGFTSNWPRWHLYGWIVSIGSGFLNILALMFLFKALARGPVAIASSAASSFSVILVILNIFSGQPYNAVQILAIIMVFFGVNMLTKPSKSLDFSNQYSISWLRITAFFGIGTGFTVALRFFLAQEAVDILGPIHTLYLSRSSALFFISIVIFWQLIAKHPLHWPKIYNYKLLIAQSLLEMLSLSAFLYGSTDNGRIGTAIGFSAFAPITTLITWAWLGEKVNLHQIIWIGIIATAILIASIFSP